MGVNKKKIIIPMLLQVIVKNMKRTLLFQSIRVRWSRSSIVIFLIQMFHFVVSLQGTRRVAGVAAVGTAKRLQNTLIVSVTVF